MPVYVSGFHGERGTGQVLQMNTVRCNQNPFSPWLLEELNEGEEGKEGHKIYPVARVDLGEGNPVFLDRCRMDGGSPAGLSQPMTPSLALFHLYCRWLI